MSLDSPPADAAPVPGRAAPASTSRRFGIALYVLRRLVQAAVIVLLVITLVFAMSHLAANPVDILLPPGSTPRERAVEAQLLGLDRPLVAQYGIFLNHLILHGSLGSSTLFHVPVLPLVARRSLATIRLAVAALVWAGALGIPLGIVLALRPRSIFDRVTAVFVALAQGTASFWLGTLLIFAFAVSLGVLPVTGDSGFDSIILPAVSLGLAPFVSLLRLTRSSMIDTLGSDYVRNARARGLARRKVVLRHALRNALPPVVTYGGILLGQLVSGAVITETIFAWPGIGQLSVLAIDNGDYAVVEGVTLVSATAVIVLNLLVDLSYLWFDPKVREVVASGGKL